jgi:PleD family two-component response regulator
MDGRVLIIDTSSYERQKVRHIVEKIGSFEIVEAQSLNQFKQRLIEWEGFNLVILDIEFPTEAGGFDLLKMLRENDMSRETPVIVTTKLDRSDIKNGALKYAVSDFIIKPYQIRRLENSIKSIVKKVDRFHYDTSNIGEIRMTFDQYISREINYSKRMNSPLSFILITPLNLNSDVTADPARSVRNDAIFSIAAEKARNSLRVTDTIVMSMERDILIVLPNTDEAGAAQVCDKIKAQIFEELEKLNAEHSEYLYPVYITCPKDGEDFQALMKSAFKKVSDKEMLEKIISIPSNTLKYADKSYSRYRKWF